MVTCTAWTVVLLCATSSLTWLSMIRKQAEQVASIFLMLLAAWQLVHIDFLGIRSRRGKRMTLFPPWSWFCWLEVDCPIGDYGASHAAEPFLHGIWRSFYSPACAPVCAGAAQMGWHWSQRPWGGHQVQASVSSHVTERLASFSYWKLQGYQSI